MGESAGAGVVVVVSSSYVVVVVLLSLGRAAIAVWISRFCKAGPLLTHRDCLLHNINSAAGAKSARSRLFWGSLVAFLACANRRHSCVRHHFMLLTDNFSLCALSRVINHWRPGYVHLFARP